MKPVRTIKLVGQTWRFLRPAKLKDRWGDCDHPDTPNRAIRVSQEARGKKELEITLHEMEHACNYLTFSEEYIAQVSREKADALWRMGWRKIEQ